MSGSGYRWDDTALRIQVTPGEMPDVLAALLGYHASVHFKNHGPKHDKSYQIQNQEHATARLVLSGGGLGSFVFTLAPADRFALSTQCFRAFQRQHGGIGSETLMQMLRDTYVGAASPTHVSGHNGPETVSPSDRKR